MNYLVPQLSSDIAFYPLNKGTYLVHQLLYNHRIKISVELYQFLLSVDGSKNLETLVDEYNNAYKSKLTVAFAHGFLYKKLADYGIVVNNEVAVKKLETSNYLNLSFILFNQSLITWFTRFLKYFFKPFVNWLMIIFFLLSVFLCVYNYGIDVFSFKILKQEWLSFFIIGFIGSVFHEFGHASASHYFGAKHGGIGIGFYLIFPVYFADVTDVWKLPKKERIIVNLAGMYFEMIYVSLLILMSFLLKVEIGLFLACVYSVFIIRSLIPFGRNDGYWVLSDLIAVPNLMLHSSDKMKMIFKSKKNWVAKDFGLLIYGVLNNSFILVICSIFIVNNVTLFSNFPYNCVIFSQSIFAFDSPKAIFQNFVYLFIPVLITYLIYSKLKSFVIFYLRKLRIKIQTKSLLF